MEDEIMDNKQERIYFLIGWFIGILEGEGSIGLNRNKWKNETCFHPRIMITNSDADILNTCIKILQLINVPYYIRKKTKQKEHRTCWQIYLWGYKRVGRLLEVIYPFVLGEKRIMIGKMLRLIRMRLDNPRHPYTEEEKELANDIYYKKCIIPREHTLTFPYGDKICSELNGDIQRLAEMANPALCE